MNRSVSSILAVLFLLAPVAAQRPADDGATSKPVRAPTRRELDRAEAVKLYGQAVQHERRQRLPEALRTYEKALRLDPDSAAVRRALVPLYLALDRHDDALAVSRKVVELEPDDFDAWFLLSRQLRSLNRNDEARAALEKAAGCSGLKDRPATRVAITLDLAALAEKAGTNDRAETAYREAAALLEQPGTLADLGAGADEVAAQLADVYERVGRLCLKAGRPGRAVEAFKTAQERDPARAARLSLNLAEVLEAQGKNAEALRYLDHYLARQPPGTEGYERKIKLLVKLDRAGQVVPMLEEYAKIDKHNNALKLLLARECAKDGQAKRAEALYEELLKAAAESEVYRGLFALYRDQGDAGVGRLLERLNAAVAAASPDDEKKDQPDAGQAVHARAMLVALRQDAALVKALLPVAHQRILKGPRLAYRTRVLLAALAQRTSQLELAERLYRSCLDAEGRVQAGGRPELEAEVYSGLLKVLGLARKHEAIVEVCQQGLKHAETTHRALFFLDLAYAQMALGRQKEALEAVGQAVDVSAEDRHRVSCRCSRATLLAQMDRFDEAEAECRAMLKEYRDEALVRQVRFALSAVCSMARKHDASEEQLQKILEADPSSARANNDLGYQWADRNKNLEQAERMIRKALELDAQQRQSNDALGLDADRDNAAYVDSLGWVLFRRGRLKEAREQLEKAAGLPDGADDPTVWDHLGDVCHRLGEAEEAVRAWKKALALFEAGRRQKTDERYKDIQQKLKHLQANR